MTRIVRYPLATSVICILAALIAVDDVSSIVGKQTHHLWALAAVVGFMVYGIALYLMVASTKGRRRLGFNGERGYAVPLFLLSIALGQVLIPIGAVFFGAETWSLWMGFGVFCVLIALWYYQTVRQS